MKFVLAFFSVMLWATVAWGATTGVWVDTPGGDSATRGTCHFPTDRVCYWDFDEATAATHVTDILVTEMCENFSVKFLSNIANGNNNNTIKVYDLLDDSIDASDVTAEVIKNATLDGDPATPTDTFAIYGVDAHRIYARATMSDGGSSVARMMVHCHPRP